MKKLLLLSVAALMAGAGALTGLKLRDVKQEELNTQIIVQLKSSPNNKTTSQIYAEQNRVLNSIRDDLGASYKLESRFSVALNGFVINVNSGRVSAIRNLPGVKDVNYNKFHEATISNPSEDDEEEGPTTATVVTEERENISYDTMEMPENTKGGEGTLIAILDTGFMINATYTDDDGKEWTNVSHAAFTELDSGISLRYTQESLKAVVDAHPEFHGKYDETHSTYFNNKVPFYYDYGGELKTEKDDEVPEEDFDVFTTASDHGNHVASIAGGNDPYYKGIAPNSQLLLMKVFTINKSGTSVGARDDSIIKALEDCAILGVDVANMSLGSTLNDFRESSIAQNVVKAVRAKGVIVNAAAGNEGRDLYWNTSHEYLTTYMVEPGYLSGYANNEASFTIASGEPDRLFYTTALKLGTHIIAYSDQYVQSRNSTYVNDIPLSSLLASGQTEGTFEWARIPGLGAESDYVDFETVHGQGSVAGKIAIVDRGEITFVEKINAAVKYGAIAIGIIDNDVTATDFNFTMSLGDGAIYNIPVVALLNKDKKVFDELDGKEPTLKISLNVIDDNNNARQISNFSSDGAKFDLSIKPEITAPGSNIFGGVYASGPHSYEYYSGTSMATPNASGAYALLLGEHADDATWKETLIDRMMSGSTPMVDKYGENFEPVRKQGSGLVNLTNSLNTKVILDGATDAESLLGKAKIELKNNDQIKNGIIDLNFTAISSADSNITYKATTYVYRPRLGEADSERYGEKFDGVKLIANQDELLVKFENNLTVQPGRNLLNTHYELTSAQKTELDGMFENGCILEGFVVLEANNEPEISIPWLGFYGDYSEAEPVEPFKFERDNSKIYQSDLLNGVCKVNKGLDYVDYGSDWVMGNWDGFEDLSLESWIYNENTLRNIKDGNGKALKPVASNPSTGAYDTTDIYMGNNGVANTMIIAQFVNRSVENNVITVTNKATDEVVLVDHMFDSLYGSMEKDDGTEFWPLFKSYADINYWSNNIIAHRAYTIIPLYEYEYDEATKTYTYGDLWADGEYEIKMVYELSAGGTFTKTYTLHVDSEAPVVNSYENIQKDGVDYLRVRFDELKLGSLAVSGYPFDVAQDEKGYYVDLKPSDYEAKDKFYIKATDYAYAIGNIISHISDKDRVTLSANTFTNAYDFKKTVNELTDKSFEMSFAYTKSNKDATVNDEIRVLLDLTNRLNGGTLTGVKVYETNAAGVKNELEITLNGNNVIFFGNSNSKFTIEYTSTGGEPLPPVVNTYSVSFSANGGTGTMETVTANEGEYTLPACTFTAPEGREFAGWKVNGEGEVLAAGSKINLSKDVELVAEWKDKGKVDPEPEPDKPSKVGCGGSIAATSILLSAISGIGVALVAISKKRRK